MGESAVSQSIKSSVNQKSPWKSNACTEEGVQGINRNGNSQQRERELHTNLRLGFPRFKDTTMGGSMGHDQPSAWTSPCSDSYITES